MIPLTRLDKDRLINYRKEVRFGHQIKRKVTLNLHYKSCPYCGKITYSPEGYVIHQNLWHQDQLRGQQ